MTAIATAAAPGRPARARRAPARRSTRGSAFSFASWIGRLEGRTRDLCNELAPGVLETEDWSAARALIVSAPVWTAVAGIIIVSRVMSVG